MGHHDRVTTQNYLNGLIEDAIGNGLPKDYHAEMRSLVFEFADIFRTSLGEDPPAAIEQMKIMLKRDATPVRVKLRRYSPSQASFLRKKVDEMVKLGLVYPNNTSQWACAPLIVPKQGVEKFRFTVDLRPVNNQTIPYVWPMPDLESISNKLA